MNSLIQIKQAWNKTFWSIYGAEKAYLLLELRDRKLAEKRSSARAPMNVSLVLDRSNSMDGEPLAYGKRACRFVADRMGAGDVLSLVAFDEHIRTVFSLQSAVRKNAMNEMIDTVYAGGRTNLSGGLLQGIQYALQGRTAVSVNRVILLSDGRADEGITRRAELQTIASEFRGMGIGITTMGVGDDVDEELLEGIADCGGGNFYLIEKPEDIPAVFSQELAGLSSISARNMRLVLKPSPSVSITKVYGYEARETNEGLEIALGDLYDQAVKSVLIECAFAPHTAGRHELLRLECGYTDAASGAENKLRAGVRAAFTRDYQIIRRSIDHYVDKQVKITESALIIERAIAAFDRGDETSGKHLLRQQADTMLYAAIQAADPDLREAANTLYSYLEKFTCSKMARKRLHDQKYRNLKRKPG